MRQIGHEEKLKENQSNCSSLHLAKEFDAFSFENQDLSVLLTIQARLLSNYSLYFFSI